MAGERHGFRLKQVRTGLANNALTHLKDTYGLDAFATSNPMAQMFVNPERFPLSTSPASEKLPESYKFALDQTLLLSRIAMPVRRAGRGLELYTFTSAFDYAVGLTASLELFLADRKVAHSVSLGSFAFPIDASSLTAMFRGREEQPSEIKEQAAAMILSELGLPAELSHADGEKRRQEQIALWKSDSDHATAAIFLQMQFNNATHNSNIDDFVFLPAKDVDGLYVIYKRNFNKCSKYQAEGFFIPSEHMLSHMESAIPPFQATAK